ncbi:MAG TPA: hypothetical protein VGB02_13205, partial [Pyrinomonadaceae bacterium]
MMIQFNTAKRAIYNREDKANNNRQQNPSEGTGVSAKIIAALLIWTILLTVALPVPAFAIDERLVESTTTTADKLASKTFLKRHDDLSKDLSSTPSALTKSPLAVINDLLGLNALNFSGGAEVNKGDKESSPKSAEPEKAVTKEVLLKRVKRIETKLDAEKTVVLGETIKLDALPLDDNGSPVHGLVLEWGSSDSQIIKIKDGNHAIATEIGEAVLTVEANEVKESTVVKVIMPSASKDLAAKIATAENAATATPLTINQLPDTERESVYSYENNLGSPMGQVEMDSPNVAAAVNIKHRAGIANYSFGVPFASLPGRGINAGIGMTYNSRTWNKSQAVNPNTQTTEPHFTYDVEQSWVAPGFTSGFGYLESAKVQRQIIFNNPTSSYNYTEPIPTGITEADGTRRQIECKTYTQANQSNSFECTEYSTSDGSMVRIIRSGWYRGVNEAYNYGDITFSVIHSDGTNVFYDKPFGSGDNRKHYPTVIQDRNGNQIHIVYKDQSGRIDYIRDTMNRYIKFYYEDIPNSSEKQLVAVTVPGFNGSGERQTIRFYYKDITIDYQGKFAGQVTAPSGNVRVLEYVYFPSTQTGYRYYYHPNFGMINKIEQFRGMSVNSTATNATGSVTSDGAWAASTSYNYPTTPLQGTNFTDVPKYTQRTDDWHGRTSATAPITDYHAPEPAQNEVTRISRITVPNGENGAIINETVSHNTGDYKNGLISETYVKDGNGLVFSKTKFFWKQGTASTGTRKNPVLEKLEITNEAGLTKTVKYLEYDQYNNPTVVEEYDFNKQNGQIGDLLRRTETSYQGGNWINSNLLHLPASIVVKVNDQPVSKVLYEYDNNGDDNFIMRRDDIDTNANSANTHSRAYNPFYPRTCTTFCDPPPGTAFSCDPRYTQCCRTICSGDYTAAAQYRGNITRIVALSDATKTNDTDDPKASVAEHRYDIAGNVVESGRLSCCRKKTITYNTAYGYAYPVSQVRGANGELATSVTYDYSTGLIKTATDENWQTVTFTYNPNTLDRTQTDLPNGGQTTTEYHPEQMPSYVKTTTKLDANHTISAWQWMDGRGAVYRARTQMPEGYVSSDVKYDNLGRAIKSSNPYTVSGLGDPVPANVKWTEATNFDALSRTLSVKLQDNTIVQTQFGQTPVVFTDPDNSQREIQGTAVTATDQAGKQRRSIADSLGRTVRLDEPDSLGNLNTVNALKTYYWYDGNDNLRKISQTGDSAEQVRLFKYDGLSRLTNEKQVEANATLNDAGQFAGTGAGAWTGYYEYDSFGLLEKGVDARNVTTTFGYDSLNRIKTVAYSGEGNLKTPSVTYNYGSDETQFNKGRLTSVVTSAIGDTPSTEHSYEYNLMGQIKKQTETIGTSSYVMEYDYYAAGGLKWQKYPSGRKVEYSIDTAGRLSNIKDAQRTYANNFQFENGLLKGMTLGNGTAESYKYNDRLQLESQSLVKDNTVQQQLKYGYGEINPATGLLANNGKVSKIENFVGGNVTTPFKQQEQQFVYDSIGRLKQSIEKRGDTGAQVYQQTYSYDRFGNRYQKAADNQNSGIGYQAIEDIDVSKSTNRFTSSAIAYDNAGNITTDNKFRSNQSYWYDANGRMIRAQVQLNNTAYQSDSVYDALGQRVAAKVNNSWQHFVYDISGQMVAEYGTPSESKGAVS